MTTSLTLQCGATSVPAKHNVVFIRSQHEWFCGHIQVLGLVTLCRNVVWNAVLVQTRLVSCHHYFNSYATSNFCSGFVRTSRYSILNIKLLCCNLMKDMSDTNTEITDTRIRLLSVIRFDFIHVCNGFTFLCYHRQVSKLSLWF
jgi:hypothetical protein